VSTNDTAPLEPETTAAPAAPGRIPLILFVGLTILAGLAFAVQWRNLNYLYASLEQQEVEEVKTTTDKAVKELDTVFGTLKSLGDSLAAGIEGGRIARPEILDHCKKAMEANPDLYSLGVAFGPFAYDPATQKYARYWLRKGHELTLIDVAASESYQDPIPGNAWFTVPMASGPTWTDPYFMDEVGQSVVEYACPFYQTGPDGSKKAAGIVYANYSMSDVKSILARIDLGKGSYAAIVSRKGTYIAHPTDEYVRAGRHVFDDEKVASSPVLREHFERSFRGESGYFEFPNDLTGQASMDCYRPIPVTGWPFWCVAIKDFQDVHADILRRQMIRVTLFGVIFLLLLFLTLLCAWDGTVWKLWTIVPFFSVLVTATIFIIWYLALNFTPYRNAAFLEITGRTGLNRFMNHQSVLAAEAHEPPPAYIPTGFFLESMNFESSNDVKVSGVIWQKYAIGAHDEIPRGFELPEAIEQEVEEKYKYKEGDVELIGWSFKATLRQQFDYTRYPFDNKDCWIRIVHPDYKRNIVLVPDLDAYPILNPTSLPGIDNEIVLAGWNLERSFFAYAFRSYNTNFGIASLQGRTNNPELYFTLIVRRNFLAPFINYVLPLFIIACIMFPVILMTTGEESKREMFDFSTADAIATISGLFFAVLLAHSAIRGQLMINGIMYIEYFCFALYLIILAVGLNSFLFSLDVDFRFIKARDNLYPKLLFWPVILSYFLLVTLNVFY